MTLPTELTAGFSAGWRVPDPEATSGWAYRYRMLGLQSFDIETTIDSGEIVVDLSAVDTADYVAGQYQWVLIRSKDGRIEEVEKGFLTINANPDQVQSFEALSHNERMLKLIESKLEGRIRTDYQRYMIDGRSLDRIPVLELEELKKKYSRRVLNEQRAKGLRKPHKRIRYI